MAGDEVGGERRIPKDRRPHGDPRGARRESAGDGITGAQAPAELHAGAAARLGHDRRGELELLRLPHPGPVEIHDVEPSRTEGGKAAGNGDRVAPVAGLPREVPLRQPHDLPASQVDRRQQVERPPVVS